MMSDLAKDLDALSGEQPAPPADHRPTPKPILGAAMIFDCIVLKTTWRSCVCGARHRNVELYEQWTAPAKLLGKPVVATKLVPIRKTRIPLDVDIQQVTAVEPIAVCPDCIEAHIKQIEKRPPLDERAWAETLRRKAVQDAEGRKQSIATPHLEVPKTLDDLAKDLGL